MPARVGVTGNSCCCLYRVLARQPRLGSAIELSIARRRRPDNHGNMGGKPIFGRCLLCQKGDLLVDSHIIPKFQYKPLKEKNGLYYILSTDPDKNEEKGQKGVETRRSRWRAWRCTRSAKRAEARSWSSYHYDCRQAYQVLRNAIVKNRGAPTKTTPALSRAVSTLVSATFCIFRNTSKRSLNG